MIRDSAHGIRMAEEQCGGNDDGSMRPAVQYAADTGGCRHSPGYAGGRRVRVRVLLRHEEMNWSCANEIVYMLGSCEILELKVKMKQLAKRITQWHSLIATNISVLSNLRTD
eukprot:gene559-3876_t